MYIFHFFAFLIAAVVVPYVVIRFIRRQRALALVKGTTGKFEEVGGAVVLTILTLALIIGGVFAVGVLILAIFKWAFGVVF